MGGGEDSNPCGSSNTTGDVASSKLVDRQTVLFAKWKREFTWLRVLSQPGTQLTPRGQCSVCLDHCPDECHFSQPVGGKIQDKSALTKHANSVT